MSNDVITYDGLKRKVERFGLEFRHYSVADMIALGYTKSMVRDENMDELYTWCQEHFNDDWIWSTHPGTGKISIYFYSRADQLLFNLRWSGQLC